MPAVVFAHFYHFLHYKPDFTSLHGTLSHHWSSLQTGMLQITFIITPTLVDQELAAVLHPGLCIIWPQIILLHISSLCWAWHCQPSRAVAICARFLRLWICCTGEDSESSATRSERLAGIWGTIQSAVHCLCASYMHGRMLRLVVRMNCLTVEYDMHGERETKKEVKRWAACIPVPTK